MKSPEQRFFDIHRTLKSNLQDCQTKYIWHEHSLLYFMSIAGGEGGGQLTGIKWEGCGSPLATAVSDCHLAQINREVSHTPEPNTRLSENSRISLDKTFWKDCLLLQSIRFWQALPCRQVASKLRPLELVSTITWCADTHCFHLETEWKTVWHKYSRYTLFPFGNRMENRLTQI